MKNSAGREGCYPPRPKAEVDKILQDLQNSSYHMKAELNNCFIIHSKYFLRSNLYTYSGPFRSLLNNTTSSPGFLGQWFINLQRVAFLASFWRQWFNNMQRAAILMSSVEYNKILCKFDQQQLVVLNYVCGFNQSETGKYFERINLNHIIIL